MPKQKKQIPMIDTAKINADKPWTANYPTLHDWLIKIEARCIDQIPMGDPRKPIAYYERWLAPSGNDFVIVVRSNRMGWNIYTAASTNEIDLSLKDAERRLGLVRDDLTSAEKATATKHGEADNACGRAWVCACGTCRRARAAGFKPEGVRTT